MGSGLILLVIVGAWLAVLVPMALRSHDSSRSLSTADKFQDAMRVLSRRDPVPAAPPARVAPRAAAPVDEAPARPATRSTAASRAALAARRRRVLTVLGAVALVTLLAGLVGPTWLLAVHALADLLVVAYVGHLRHQTVLRHEREWRDALGERVPAARPAARPAAARPAAARRAAADDHGLAGLGLVGEDVTERAPERHGAPDRLAAGRPVERRVGARVVQRPAAARSVPRPAARAAAPASVRPVAPAHVAGVPDRMPPRPAPLAVPVRGAVGEPWAPVPVPLPGYVTAPTAPRRVLDLTRPGEWSDGVAAAERELGIDDQGPELEEILDRRRAAGDW